MKIKFSLFYKLMVLVFKQYLLKQCLIYGKISSAIDLYFGDFSNDHFGELILGWKLCSLWGIITWRPIHKYRSLILCLFHLNSDFPLQAIKSVQWNFMSLCLQGRISKVKLKFRNEWLIFGRAYNEEAYFWVCNSYL